MEIIDNSRELKGFENNDEDIKLVGYFKSHKSERKNFNCECVIVPVHNLNTPHVQQIPGRKPETQPIRFLTVSDFEAFADAAEEFHPHIYFYATFNPKVSKRHCQLQIQSQNMQLL